MFFKDIDSWGKRKLALMTALCGIAYLVFATIIPIIIINSKYDLVKGATFKASLIGIIVITLIVTAGFKAVKFVIGILPSVKRNQQIIKFGLETLIVFAFLGCARYITFLIKSNLDMALFCINGTIYSYFGATFIEFTCLKTLQVQWSCEAKVDEREKLDAISNSRKK